MPEFNPTVTDEVLLLLQVPPVAPALRPKVASVYPHRLDVPEITGSALSVTTIEAVQPAPGVT